MTKREEYETKVEAYLLPLLENYQFELVDIEYVKEARNWFLRAYIDKEGGITVDDCEIVSRRLSDWLDQNDFIEDSYIMEVSSPGLGRPLKKEKDFQRSLGKAVDIKLYKAAASGTEYSSDKHGQKAVRAKGQKDFSGILTAFDKEKVSITREDGELQEFERSGIALIRLAFDF